MTTSSSTRARVLAHLVPLVAADTRNPPRADAGIDALFAHVRGVLGDCGFVVVEKDLGTGCRWLHATRGAAGKNVPLVNVHIDTVPRDDGWLHDPWTLRTAIVDDEERAVGLGACDIKGAVAAFLVAAEDTTGPAELLLSSDEEAGSSTCIRTFVVEHDVVDRLVLVAEPTRGTAVVAHRGIGTAVVAFNGVAGHASAQRATVDSAVAEAVRFCSKALAVADADDNTIRLNLGRIEGGTKANMIASSCLLRFGVRPPPEHTPEHVLSTLSALVTSSRASFERGFLAPACPAP
ncbi:MAG TPA: M20/M25/M40 family metallo-hydrolase, partial [Myxococcota bacterium]